MDKVKVLIGGLEFDNFEEMRIYSDLYSLADTFSFAGVLARADGRQPNVSPARANRTLKCGDRCVITINSKTVMNGFLTNLRLSNCPDTGTLLDFGGVDVCGRISRLTAAEFKEGDFTPLQIITELRRQIPAMQNVAVSGISNLGVLEDFAIQTGATVSTIFNAIADRFNMIFYAMPCGNIAFGERSKGGTYHNITVGRDRVKKTTLTRSLQDVFDELVYICEDEDGFLQRELVRVPFVPETQTIQHTRMIAKPDEIKYSAQKEANEIIARHLRLNVEYAGFTDSAGKIWEINKAVNFSDITDTKIFNGNLILESVEFRQTRNEGQTSNLTLTLPAAY
jgi:prophage tail gpP-like protein